MRSLKSTASTTTTVVITGGGGSESASASASAPAAAAAMQRSPWHSPVPYLFGGLAAMLGLIAFALLILACSYWKLSGQINGEEGEDLESGDDDVGKGKGKGKGRAVVYEEQFVVIMAGDDKPSCLATPVSSRPKSAIAGTDTNYNGSGDEKVEKGEKEGDEESNSDMSSEQRHHELGLDEESETSSS